MKIILTCTLSALICTSSLAQVEVEKSKGTLTGKSSLLAENIPESILDHFNVNFYTYFKGSDEGGNNAKGSFNTASIEAELDGLDTKLAQEITDEAYAYFLEKWKSKGVTVKCPTAAEIEATKQFTKDKGKGKAELIAPGSYTEGNAYAKYLRVLPTNAPQVKKEYYGNFVYGNAQFFPTDFSGNTSSVNFHIDINFISFKNGFGTKAAIRGKVGLKTTAGGSVVLWVKAKNLAAGYSNEGIGGSDFYEHDGNSKLFSGTDEGSFASHSKWIVKINKDAYKAKTLELIKKSIDSQFAEYDEDVAKAKK
ncbi:MAG: hypothetical protein KA163_14690 [Bacteroidia bacterium]|nr:hypothetical protein [Bacteroidia bacterium]